MTGPERGILLVILKSQLEIERAVMKRLDIMSKDYGAITVLAEFSMTAEKILEITRQIKTLES